MRRARIALVACVLFGFSARAGAEPILAALAARVPSVSVSSVFHIEKSENKNQVHYAVQVDAECRPLGQKPVYGYWRDLEVGPRAVSPLLSHEQPAYGLTDPRSVRRDRNGGEIRIGLRGFPDRALTITTFREGDKCRARTLTLIHKQAALLTSIYVKLGFLFSVDYVIVHGVRVADGVVVEEKVDD
jgi:Domain of unknown function (DUF4833)